MRDSLFPQLRFQYARSGEYYSSIAIFSHVGEWGYAWTAHNRTDYSIITLNYRAPFFRPGDNDESGTGIPVRHRTRVP